MTIPLGRNFSTFLSHWNHLPDADENAVTQPVVIRSFVYSYSVYLVKIAFIVSLEQSVSLTDLGTWTQSTSSFCTIFAFASISGAVAERGFLGIGVAYGQCFLIHWNRNGFDLTFEMGMASF